MLSELYQQYLLDQDTGAFAHRVSVRYAVASLARLVVMGDRNARRGSVLAISHLGDYESNAALGRALVDSDRGVRLLADSGIRLLWHKAGSAPQRLLLARVTKLNQMQHLHAALREVSRLTREAPWIAEGWNQQAIAHFGLADYLEAIRSCRQTLEINPYHFGAASGLGQCYLKLGDQVAALDAFRRAIALNPELEGVRANIRLLQRSLKRNQ